MVTLKEAPKNAKKDRIVNFDKDSFMAVKGTDKSFFDGEIKVVHRVQGEKMIKNKQAEEVKADLVEVENPNRSVKDKPNN